VSLYRKKKEKKYHLKLQNTLGGACCSHAAIIREGEIFQWDFRAKKADFGIFWWNDSNSGGGDCWWLIRDNQQFKALGPLGS